MRRTVTVFGAGIAGLTAAHELATRGFRVQVIDPDYNEECATTALDRGIGGMARSQWAVDPKGDPSGDDMRRLWPASTLLHEVGIAFDANGKVIDEPHAAKVFDALVDAYAKLNDARLWPDTIGLRVFGLSSPAALAEDARVQYIRAELTKRGVAEDVIDGLFEPVNAPGTNAVFHVRIGVIVPAEHGFRFFPSFYRHLFDTMRRTPITQPGEWQRTKASTYDNLVACEGLGFARAGKAVSFLIPRHAMSMTQTRAILHQVIGELGYTESDISRFSLKLFKYMTSCSERRAGEYETMSWGDFLESWRYSPISRQHIEFGPQMSAALRGSRSDARTQGNITVQLLMDQLKKDAEADYTLEGPTSSYWLDHWHDFLLSQDVEFKRGSLVDFKMKDGKIVPVVSDGVEVTGEIFVLALSLPAMKKVADKFIQAAGSHRVTGLDQMRKVRDFAGDVDLNKPVPKGPLQHLSGIQYYFAQEVRFWRGHTQYLDSEWGLTSIAQMQFWRRPRGVHDYYRAILSVDIGIFDRAYKPKGGVAKCAWECTADEIARYAWEQIVDGHDDAFKKLYGDAAEIPTPIAYSLDCNLCWKSEALCDNTSPFLVNETGMYPTRPGNVNLERKNVSNYEVIADAYIMCGTHMQTFTRLTSMEGANESARHAVNALLQWLNIPGDRCQIWDPEEREIDDLAVFKELDATLYKRGLPHFTDILGWDELPDQLEHAKTLARAIAGGHR